MTKAETSESTVLTLTLEKLPRPFVKRWDSIAGWLVSGSGRLIGFLLSEREEWNRSLHIWEFHVRPDHQRQGIGRLLMDEAVARARAAGYRVIVCETPNTNAPAIHAYRALGFEVGAIDLFYYSNEGADTGRPDAEVAVFMKLKL